MSGRFANLKNLQTPEPEPPVEPSPEPGGTTAPSLRETAGLPDSASATGRPDALPGKTDDQARPWESAAEHTEPVKALNGRVPRSVRLAFDRQLTDAMDTLRIDVTVDLAVEALARLIIDDAEMRERWLHQLWTLKRRH